MLSCKEKIHNYIINNKDEIVGILKELVKIPSVMGEAVHGAPFGEACRDVLLHTQKLYKENGFETELDQEGGYLLSDYGDGTKSLGLFAHADVVPVGDDWILTKPFEPVEKDGYLIGRGVLDDKSAIVISLYCMKMLKELDIPFNSRLVCFTGANEEAGMADITNYVVTHKAPDFSLVCDTAFPLYRGNKGMLQLTAICNEPLESIKDIKGSNVKGAVTANAEAKLNYTDEVYQGLKMREDDNTSVTCENDEVIIRTCGISNHTATPEGSLNAGYLLFNLLKKCQYISENDRKQAGFMSEILGNYYGEPIGIENTDPDFGELTFVNDIIRVEKGRVRLHFNLRFGACVNIGELKEKIKGAFSKKGWSISFESEGAAFITDINNPMLKACLTAYKEFTGNTAPTVRVNAGGTYARHLPCAVEIGPTLKGDYPEGMPKGHGCAHQPDECINIEGMLQAIELTMLMLLECDKN